MTHPDRTAERGAGPGDGADVVVELRHVSCRYDGSPVIEDVDLVVRRCDFVGIVGPSGSGKTTVVRAVLGAVRPSFGSVRVAPGVRIAYVPQVGSVDWNFPVSVTEVVAMSLPQRRLRPGPTASERASISAVLDQLDLGELADRHIAALSGGQQQRVFLARALVQRPDLLVLDEPTNGIDVHTRHEILHVLSDLHADGITVLLTTHDLNGLAAHLPRLVCFNRTVVADGRPLEVLHPYVLERTYGAPMAVLRHDGLPVVIDR